MDLNTLGIEIIKQDEVNNVLVSTVKLPNDEWYQGEYETLVLDGDWSEEAFERRTNTLEQAMKNHSKGIAYVMKKYPIRIEIPAHILNTKAGE